MRAMTAKRGFAPAPASVSSEEADRERASRFAAKARAGTHALLAIRVFTVFITFLSVPILARLIPPADFGIWAMAMLAVGLMTIVSEGLGVAVVQAPKLTLEEQSAYFWATVGVSLASAGVLALAAPLVAHFYDTALVRHVVEACSVALALKGLGLVHTALLRRNFEYNKLMLIEGGGMTCGLITSLLAAYYWRDVWALVAAQIAMAAWMSSAAFLLCPFVPGGAHRSAKIDLRFSVQVMQYNILTYLANNVGLAAGYRFSLADLGFFNRGQQLYHLAHFSFLMPITEMGFALLCRLEERAYINAYISLARRVAILFIPCAAVLPIVSGDLVLALLGPAWKPAGAIVACLAPAVVGQAFALLLAQLITSQGRGKELRGWSVANLVLRAAGAVLGSRFGVVGMTAGFSLATLLALPLMVWISGRSGPVKLRHQLVAIWPGLLLAAPAAIAAVLAVLAANAVELSAGWRRLLVVGGAAVLAWALVCLVLRPAREALFGKGIARG